MCKTCCCKSRRTNRSAAVISEAVGGSLSCKVYETPMLSIIYQEMALRATRESESFSLSFGEQRTCAWGLREKMCRHAYVWKYVFVCVCLCVCVCVCVCVVREVNVFLLAHSGGSSWCKRRRGLLVLTLVPVFHSEHAGPPITATHHWAPQTWRCVCVCVCVCVSVNSFRAKENKLTRADCDATN